MMISYNGDFSFFKPTPEEVPRFQVISDPKDAIDHDPGGKFNLIETVTSKEFCK